MSQTKKKKQEKTKKKKTKNHKRIFVLVFRFEINEQTFQKLLIIN